MVAASLVSGVCVSTEWCGIPGDWGAEDHDEHMEDGDHREG